MKRAFIIRRSLFLAVLLTSIGVVNFFARDAMGEAGFRIAVLEFNNASTDTTLAPLGKGLQAMVTTDLSNAPSVTIVERERLRDIARELHLSKTGLIDGKSAARIGKLLGATQLLAGTFTVHGEHMRIDWRLFSVSTGDQLMADKVEGEKNTFFELEKTLVAGIIKRIGIALKPKERVAVARVHTADFSAFRSFGEGIAYFDEKRYTEALGALQQATNIDKDFTLARLTLQDYERIVSQLQTSTLLYKQAEEQLRQEKAQVAANEQRQKEVSRLHHEQKMLQRLWEQASTTGKDHATRLARLWACYVLAFLYREGGHIPGADSIEALRSQDPFALKRIADLLFIRYWAESEEVFPELPLTIPDYSQHRIYDGDMMRAAVGRWDGAFKYAQDMFSHRHPWDRQDDLLIEKNRGFAAGLHLDTKQTLDFEEKLIEHGMKLDPPIDWILKQLQQYAEDCQKALYVDRSTAAYLRLLHHAKALRQESTMRWVESVTRQIEINRTLAELLSSPSAPLLRSCFSRDGDRIRNLIATEFDRNFSAADNLHRVTTGPGRDCWDPSLNFKLQEQQGNGLYVSTYRLIGNHPIWQLSNPINGPSRLSAPFEGDGLRSSRLRYTGTHPQASAIAIVDGLSRSDVELSFYLEFPPAAPRPEVALLFGANQIVQHEVPFHGYALSLGPDLALRFIALQAIPGYASGIGSATGANPFGARIMGQHNVPVPGNPMMQVRFRVAADSISLWLDGVPYNFAPPPDRKGFYGLYFAGRGSAMIHQLQVQADAEK